MAQGSSVSPTPPPIHQERDKETVSLEDHSGETVYGVAGERDESPSDHSERPKPSRKKQPESSVPCELAGEEVLLSGSKAFNGPHVSSLSQEVIGQRRSSSRCQLLQGLEHADVIHRACRDTGRRLWILRQVMIDRHRADHGRSLLCCHANRVPNRRRLDKGIGQSSPRALTARVLSKPTDRGDRGVGWVASLPTPIRQFGREHRDEHARGHEKCNRPTRVRFR